SFGLTTDQRGVARPFEDPNIPNASGGDGSDIGAYEAQGCRTSTFAENFDGVIAPALPAGWTATNVSGFAPPWTTSMIAPASAPNDAFVDDPPTISDNRLDSPSIAIATSSAQLTFQNNYDFEFSFGQWLDGGVLEISIGGGAFTDILLAGGSFASAGYN